MTPNRSMGAICCIYSKPTCCKFLWNRWVIIMLRSEILSGMCAELRTVAASDNRDHPTRSLSSSPFTSTINYSPGLQALLEVTHQDHSIGITLLLLVRATYIYFCSSRTSRSWWITQSTQRHRRGCNIHNFYFEKAGNKQFWRFTPVINENHQFFHGFYVICTICLLALSSAYWAETQVWLGASNWVYVKWNQIVNDSYDRGWFL